MPITIGSRLGRYEILGRLGAGGMGEVYRARDSRLARDVALKVLAQAIAADPALLERFAREARAVAALNHPHIVTIYSIEEEDGIPFFTMELVEGATLEGLIPADGLPLGRFLDLAMPLTEALDAAHQKHIVHRDLKPANVMVSADGRVKVLDFGLAHLAPPVAADQTIDATRAVLTQQGTIAGTMPYMSPEQIEGRPLDSRSDLFSLGILFYEMLTGMRPFGGDSSPQLMSAILRDTPPAVSDRRSDLPESIVRVVERLLEKRPEDRVQTARDVFNELRHLRKTIESGTARRPDTGAPTAPQRSTPSSGARRRDARWKWIAVLPFTCRAEDEECSALAEGLTDDITAGLSRFDTLRVVSRASTEGLKGQVSDPGAAAALLGARYLLEGSLRRAGTSVRVNVRLVDADMGAHLWAEHYDRSLDAGTFVLQDDIARRVVATIADGAGVLTRSMAMTVKDRPVEALTLDELTLRFFGYIEVFRPEEHARLRSAFEVALQHDRAHAGGWACLAMLYEHEHSHGLNPLPDPLGRLRRAAERAVEADPMNQHGWSALASAAFFGRDLTALQAAAERAIAINPLHANTTALLAIFLESAGDSDRAVELVGQAMTMNPHHPGWYHFVPFTSSYRRREYAEALVHAKRINMPLFPWSQLSSAAAAGQLGRAPEARASLDALARTHPHFLEPGNVRDDWGRWIWDPELLDRLIEGVEKAHALTRSAV